MLVELAERGREGMDEDDDERWAREACVGV
jgi:hypothetical protein